MPHRRSSPLSPFWAATLPGLYLLLVLGIDYLIPCGTITPFFVVLGLLLMAPTFRPGQMIPWAILYTAVVGAIFISPKLFVLFSGHIPREHAFVHWLRAATYFMVGGLSCYLCLALDKLRKKESGLAEILSKLPWPILVSDHNGRILYWNESALKLLPALTEGAGVLNYFDLLARPGCQGQTIAAYFHHLDENDHQEPLELQVNGYPIQGFTETLDWSGHKNLLTILPGENERERVKQELDSVEQNKSE